MLLIDGKLKKMEIWGRWYAFSYRGAWHKTVWGGWGCASLVTILLNA